MKQRRRRSGVADTAQEAAQMTDAAFEQEIQCCRVVMFLYILNIGREIRIALKGMLRDKADSTLTQGYTFGNITYL